MLIFESPEQSISPNPNGKDSVLLPEFHSKENRIFDRFFPLSPKIGLFEALSESQ
jgi:hypothetical protein